MTDRWVLMAGCSAGGIGDALARTLHKKGFKIIATARNVSGIDANLAASSGFQTLLLDVNSQQSIDAAAQKDQQPQVAWTSSLTVIAVTKLASGRLHYLINNSGLLHPILDLDLAQVRSTFETNVMSVIALPQAFFPLLRAARGAIVINASPGGVNASYLPFGGAYNNSKAATAKLSQTVRLELAPFRLTVVTLYAGGVETNLCNNLARNGDTKLKAGSLYKPMWKEAEYIMNGAFIQNSPLDPWAETVAT